MLHIGYAVYHALRELNLVSLVIAACVCLRGWLVIRMLCQRWFRTGAVYMPGGAMSAVSCSGSLSDPSAPPPSPPPPLSNMSMQADQDWCEGLWQWIHLSVVFVCVYNDHWNCWSEKCKKRYAWLQAIQVSGDKTHHLYLYLHWNCSSFVFLPAHIFSYLYLCVCRDNISHCE